MTFLIAFVLSCVFFSSSSGANEQNWSGEWRGYLRCEAERSNFVFSIPAVKEIQIYVAEDRANFFLLDSVRRRWEFSARINSDGSVHANEATSSVQNWQSLIDIRGNFSGGRFVGAANWSEYDSQNAMRAFARCNFSLSRSADMPAVAVGGARSGEVASRGTRIALVIGNGAYRSAPRLSNPPRDATAVAAALRRVGFNVELVIDANREQMVDALNRLSSRASGADAAMFFYAGHAMEVSGQNILIPVSAPLGNQAHLRSSTIYFSEVNRVLAGKAATTLIFLDACRDNPFAAVYRDGPTLDGVAASALSGPTRSVTRGLAGVASGTGTLIAFATAPGQVALDGNRRNSPFTVALLEHLETPGIEVRQMLSRVRRSVREMTHGSQIPWDNSSLETNFFFMPANSSIRR